MINELINYINEELDLIKIEIDSCDNKQYYISLATDLLKTCRNLNNWESLFNNSDFIEIFQELNLDENVYNNVILSYNHIKEIYTILKELQYDTISLDEIDDFVDFKNNIIDILNDLIFQKNTIKISREVFKQNKEDYLDLLNKLKSKDLIDSNYFDLINSIIRKRCSSEHQTEILMWLNEYNNEINYRKRNKKRADDVNKNYLEAIHQIFDDSDSIAYFNELLEMYIPIYKNLKPEEFDRALEQLYIQYKNLPGSNYYHFTMDFFGKYIIGLEETFKKLKAEEELELEMFKSENCEKDEDIIIIIEDEKKQIADYDNKINICKKVINFYFKQEGKNSDDNEEELDGDILSQSDYEKIINGIKNKTHNIVLFGSWDGKEIKGNFVKQFEDYNNDVKSDLKDIRKILHYLITTDEINTISAEESSVILELAKMNHDIKGCSTVRASKRADSRIIIKNIAPGVIYIVGIWSKGDEKDYCRVASTIIDKIDFDEIRRQLNSADGNNFIIKNLDYSFRIYNKLCQKINGKNLSNK